MDLLKVDHHNVGTLFELNRELAVEEGQADLFIADYSEYQSAFLSETPVAQAYLCMEINTPVGFYIYSYKFSSYLGAKVLHIEDIYLLKEYREKNIEKLLGHVAQVGSDANCCRVEMRVLKAFNMGYNFIENAGFREVEKWDIFRFGNK